MTLRTPRRRISPRAKRRYRAIKDFLRRALGNNSSSQPDIKINSSIAINVTDLKHKIVGLEQQLTEVNKHCRDLVCLESSSRKDSQTLVTTLDRHDLPSLKEQTDTTSNKRVHHGDETKLLYKTSESHYRKSDESDSIEKVYHDSKRKDMRFSEDMPAQSYGNEVKIRKKKSKSDNRLKSPEAARPGLRKHKARSTYENLASTYGATTSYYSLHEPRTGRQRFKDYPGHHYEEYLKKYDYAEPKATEIRAKKQSRRNSPERSHEQHESKHRRKRKKSTTRELNEDFIADIIKRQYKPMKMFGKRETEMSQFSAPVCRDQEYPIRENILEGSELCSCCFDRRRKSRYECEYDLSDMRSICDTRLYSAKRQLTETRHRYHRKHANNYNDSNQYDLIPVKEKASPKSRRKYEYDAVMPYGYKEVPPSPRTHRPRLNLKSQYYDEFEDYMLQKKNRNGSPKRSRSRKHLKPPGICENDGSSDAITIPNEKRKPQPITKSHNITHIQQDVGTMSSLQSPLYINTQEHINQDSTFNKTQETDSSTDKTDKALSEIKDILQSFLQEIKKEATVSQCDNSEINSKVINGDKCLDEFRQDTAKLTSSVIPNNGHNVNNYSVPQCGIPSPFMQSFANPCCYPMLPVCPMNCMPNGYIMPNPSFTCASCANNVKDDVYHKSTSPKESNNNVKNSSETDQLIKEIYKFVAQSPMSSRRKDYHEKTKNDSPKDGNNGKMTTRSVGGSSKLSRHDAQVETQKIKCHSKSCEAIGSRFLSDTTYSRTNPSYSDTVLERLSLEAATGSESEMSSESTEAKKHKYNKFAKVLRSFGLFKKKKDVIEELSESESTLEVEVKPKQPPFRQEVMNYVMHEQEYFNRPQSPHPHSHHAGAYEPRPPDYRHGCGCHSGCPDHLNHVNPMQAQYHHCHSPKPEHSIPPAAGYRSPHRPSAPPYPYEGHSHNQPQVPLCLKEIEVKSIGTQSDRKMNLFRKFTKKMQPPMSPVSHAQRAEEAQNCSTQTAQEKPNLFNWKTAARPPLAKKQTIQLGKDKPALWSWKTLQAKVNQLDHPNEMGMAYSYKTQKQLAQGDIKMRNAMLKKLFYKRNPFSPRNLIVRTILGKDKSSYGEPPMMYRPRMFF